MNFDGCQTSKASPKKRIAATMLNISALISSSWIHGMQRWTLHGAEEALQFLEGLLGTFFLQEMAAIETAPGNR